MPTRSFTDAAGVRWFVWCTVPEAGSHLLAPELADGWLTFESDRGERRRSYPLPDDWQHLAPEQLAALCARAARVTAQPLRESSRDGRDTAHDRRDSDVPSR